MFRQTSDLLVLESVGCVGVCVSLAGGGGRGREIERRRADRDMSEV